MGAHLPAAACAAVVAAAAAAAVYGNCCLNCAGTLIGTLPTGSGGVNPYRMLIQNDGNVRIVDSSTVPRLMWQTNTAGLRTTARAAARRQSLPDAGTDLEMGPGKH
jgi:hypothetical protein